MYKFFFILLFPLCCFGQSTNKTLLPIDTNFISQAKQFVKDLYQPGLELKKDSLFISEEFKLMMKDSVYRQYLFPETYTWAVTVELLKEKRLRHAFWFLLNLYPQTEKDKDLVLQVILNYDKIFEMDKVLTGVLYTYTFFDPRISKMVNEKPEIIHPDIFERMMKDVKDINIYIDHFRKNSPK